MNTDKNIKIFAFADEAGGHVDHQIKALLRNGLNGIEIRNPLFCFRMILLRFKLFGKVNNWI